MPILSNEVSLYPTGLLDHPASEDGRSWSVVHTSSSQEMYVARKLLTRNTPFYLPVIPNGRRVLGRRVCSFLPLFPGHLFLFGTAEERFLTQQNSHVSSVFPVPDPDQLCAELRQVQFLIESDAPLTQESRLIPGDRVRIKQGSLQGLEGTVIRRENTTRLLITVNYLQQGVSIQIDDFLVERV